MIDCGTCQVGFTKMFSICAENAGLGVAGLPTTIRVLNTVVPSWTVLRREVGNVDHHVGLAEIARQPAPALHVGDDGVDVAVPAAAVERIDGGLRPARHWPRGPCASGTLSPHRRSGRRIGRVVPSAGRCRRSRSSGTRGSSIGFFCTLRTLPCGICTVSVSPLRPRNSASLAFKARKPSCGGLKPSSTVRGIGRAGKLGQHVGGLREPVAQSRCWG